MTAADYNDNIPLKYLDFALETQMKLYSMLKSDKTYEEKYEELEAYSSIRVTEINELCKAIIIQLQHDTEIEKEYLNSLYSLNDTLHNATRTKTISQCSTASSTLAQDNQ